MEPTTGIELEAQCECEHIEHTNEEPGYCNGVAAQYRHSPYGVFHVCDECGNGHYSVFPRWPESK